MNEPSELPHKTRWNHFWGYPCLFGLAVFLLDMLTKILIDHCIPLCDGFVVIPNIFNIIHVRNTGAAWSIFNQHTWLLGLLSLVCLAALVIFFDRLSSRKSFPSVVLGILSGGIAGNMVDRLLRGSVIDFLDFHWKEVYHYPTFNVADIAICTTIALLMLWSFFSKEARSEAPASQKTETQEKA